MFDYNAAEKAVLELLRETERGINESGSVSTGHSSETRVRLIIFEVIEQDFGWVFLYETLENVPSNAHGSGLAVNAPLIFDKSDGIIYITETANSLESYLELYRRGIRVPA
jgi:hypothetical protein